MKTINLDYEFENGSPARVHRPTGTVFLPPSFYLNYTPEQQEFMLLHEEGHFLKNTRSEFEADIYAANRIIEKQGLKKTFKLLNDTLFNGIENDARRIHLFNYLKYIDNMELITPDFIIDDEILLFDGYEETGIGFENEDGFIYLNDHVGIGEELDELEVPDYINWCQFYGREFSDATKKEERQAKRAQRQAQREQKKVARQAAKEAKRAARTDVIQARADAKRARADAKLTLAEQGIESGFGAGVKNVFSGLLGGVQNLFGGGGGGGYVGDDDIYFEGEKSNTPLIIGGIVAALVIGVIIFLIVRKK